MRSGRRRFGRAGHEMNGFSSSFSRAREWLVRATNRWDATRSIFDEISSIITLANSLLLAIDHVEKNYDLSLRSFYSSPRASSSRFLSGRFDRETCCMVRMCKGESDRFKIGRVADSRTAGLEEVEGIAFAFGCRGSP